MSEQRSDQYKKITLDTALRAIAGSVVDTAIQAGLNAESLKLEMQFGLETTNGEVTPVVFVNESPPGHPVHRLQFTVGLSSTMSESERVRLELEALTRDVADDTNSSEGAGVVIDDGPRKRDRQEPDGVLIDVPPVGSGDAKSPRIVVPAKPVLKLRHASEMTKRPKRTTGDEPPAKHAELDFSPPSEPGLSRSGSSSSAPVIRDVESSGEKSDDGDAESQLPQNAASRFVVFDHQVVSGSSARTSGATETSSRD